MSDLANGVSDREDADALVLGLSLLSTGGGGLPERGRSYLYDLLEEGYLVSWTSAEEIEPTRLTCSVFGMGSIAPHAPMSEEEQLSYGIVGEAVSRPGVRAVSELGKYLGEEPAAVVPFELGPFNTIVAIDAASRLGMTLVDGDYVGRAVPEMSQALPAALGYRVWPLAICDHWGSSLLMTDCPSAMVAERIGKMISIVTKTPDMMATCAHAAFPLQMREAAQSLVAGSLTRALHLGRRVREARSEGLDPVQEAAVSLDGWILFRGVVQRVEWEDGDGYMIGTTYLSNGDDSSVKDARIWFKNENHVIYRGENVVATSPDLIAVVTDPEADPQPNTLLKAGMPVAVLGFRCDERYRTGAARRLTEPRHYGLDIDYVPIERLNSV